MSLKHQRGICRERERYAGTYLREPCPDRGIGDRGGCDSLSGTLTADDGIAAYVSTTAASLGTLAVNGLGTFWGNSKSFNNVALTPAVTNYLQIIAYDGSPPGMIIGKFTLSDADFFFPNNTQTLITGNSGWTGDLLQSASWAAPSDSVTTIGPSGTSPWGNLIPGASFVWPADAFSGNQACGDCYVALLVPIMPVITPPAEGLPEPMSGALFGAGLLGLAMVRRRA